MQAAPETSNPFRPRWDHARGLRGAFLRLTGPAWLPALGLTDLAEVYDAIRRDSSQRGFCEKALAVLGVTWRATADELRHIPTMGPLMVVANHPFGGLEGLILSALVRRVRPDVKIMANYLLGRMPEMREESILVDPFGGPGAAGKNLASLRQACNWLEHGHVLAVFPAGEVAHWSWRRRSVSDPPWSATIGRIIQRTRATVVPVHFDGRNSDLFQFAGLVHPSLRTAMLPRELLRKRKTEVFLRVGASISPARLARFRSPGRLTDYLRLRTHLLRPRRSDRAANQNHRPTQSSQALARPIDAARLAAEIAGLSADRLLVAHGEFQAYCVPAGEIPLALREIGRLREQTFREVGEGTGRCIDLDCFDDDYQHLFLWDSRSARIAGAYRIGLADLLAARRGVAGLYTHTLFRYDRRLLQQLGPALELGRSFVTAEYQKSYAPLMLLWKGISRFVLRNPRYRILFGPVSISAEYDSMTQRLLMAFLRQRRQDDRLAELVRPRNPPRFSGIREMESDLARTSVENLEDVEELVRDIERDRRGIPILVRQYLGLGAKLLGFNVDPDFGDVLDGLFCVDLTRVQPAMLRRYFGREEAEGYLAHHGMSDQSASAGTVRSR